MLIIIGSIFITLDKYRREITLGSKWVWIPLAIISLSMVARIAVDFSYHTIGGVLAGCIFFAVYLTGRILKEYIWGMFAIATVVVAVSVIVYGIIYSGEVSGGIMTGRLPETGRIANFNIVKTFLMFGAAVSVFKYRWHLVTLSLVALYFTGNIEAVIGLLILPIVVVAKKDWSSRLAISTSILLVVIVGWTALGYGRTLYSFTGYKIKTGVAVTREGDAAFDKIDDLTTGRLIDIKEAMSDIKPLGHGLKITEIDQKTVHNVPLVIVDQIGPIAGVAWLFLVFWCLLKTRYKYAWMSIIAMSLFSHEVWTQAAPYWWVLTGVSTASNIKDDAIFKSVGLSNSR